MTGSEFSDIMRNYWHMPTIYHAREDQYQVFIVSDNTHFFIYDGEDVRKWDWDDVISIIEGDLFLYNERRGKT